MECVHPTANYWRDKMHNEEDEDVQASLQWLWAPINDREIGPPYGRGHHDFTGARAATLRECRKRGLDISVVRLGT